MIIHILREPATAEQIAEMLQANRFYIKTAVDISRQILAGGVKCTLTACWEAYE